MKRTVILLACIALCACSKDLAKQVPDAGVPDARMLPATSIVFINTSPTQFTPGELADIDSVTNVTGIIDKTASTTGLLATGIWPDAVTCLREMLTPYNVVVVEDDPGDVEHIEIAVSNAPADIGLDFATAGITSATEDCTGLRRGVAFAFDVYPSSMEATCHNLGWLLGHTVGIDSLHHCPDVTTFLDGCGAKSFTDRESECGEYEARECLCGGTTQNSHQKMLDFYGPSQ